jgi:hypothetical protein
MPTDVTRFRISSTAGESTSRDPEYFKVTHQSVNSTAGPCLSHGRPRTAGRGEVSSDERAPRGKPGFGPSAYDQRSFRAADVRSDAAEQPRRVTVDDLRRAVDSVRDLSDPALMAKAWDEPTTRDVQPATNSPRRFGQLDNLSVPDDFDVPLPDTEIIAGEGDSPAEQPRAHPGRRADMSP